VIVAILAFGWAVLLSAPLARRARATGARDRAAVLGATVVGEDASAPLRVRSGAVRSQLRVVQRVVGQIGARRRARHLDDVVARELPVTIDLLAVAVGAGCTPFLAVDAATRWGPPLLAGRLREVRRACSLGRGFEGALDDLATAIPRLRPLADAMLASERFGAPVGDALARLAAEQRTSLRRRAETRARTVPVRLLFPLVFLVLPAFGLLTVVPAVLGGLGGP